MSISYFEITGDVIECVTSHPSSPPPVPSEVTKMLRKQHPKGGEERTVRSASPRRRSYRSDIRHMIGKSMVATGSTILLVPDPLPIVDELVGVTLLASGVYLSSTE